MTFRRIHVIVAGGAVFAAVAASVLLCGGGYFIYRWKDRSAHSSRFAKHIDEYLAPAEQLPDQEAYVRGKVVVIDVKTKVVDDDVFHGLPAALRANRPEEVGTVVRIRWGVHFVGHFENKAGRDLGSASAATGEVTVIDQSMNAILERRTFQSNNVVRGIDGGAKPIDEIVDYLAKLPREAAKKNEPPPKGWLVLFRSNDPSVWNKDSKGEKFALPVRRAPSKTRYLRLKRIDTGEFLITPMTVKRLARDDSPNPAEGIWWNGTSAHGWGGHHLGLAQVPPATVTPRVTIAISGDAGGSGFGHKAFVDDKQYYCWQGREIPKTTFEIAVTSETLTDEEKRRLVVPDRKDGPAPNGWTVLFRSDDPLDWNTVRTDDRFALPISFAHGGIRHLRLKRIDTGACVVVPITYKHVSGDAKPDAQASAWWNGTIRHAANARQLGVAQTPALNNDFRGIVGIARDGGAVFMGSGFGWKTGGEEKQFYCWQGAEIPRTTFEIAVSANPLTEEERNHLPTPLPRPPQTFPEYPPAAPIANAIAQPAPPPAVAGKKTVDLIGIFEQKKDVVYGRWVVVDKALHCNDQGNVPRVQFRYEPPAEYDVTVTFSQPTLRNCIALVMPNPNCGMFHFGFGYNGGYRYGFHGKDQKSIDKVLRPNTAYTVTVQVRKDGIKAFQDGKEIIAHATDFRDLSCDGYRDMPNKKYLAVACDDPTVFHYVRIVEVTGAGKDAR